MHKKILAVKHHSTRPSNTAPGHTSSCNPNNKYQSPWQRANFPKNKRIHDYISTINQEKHLSALEAVSAFDNFHVIAKKSNRDTWSQSINTTADGTESSSRRYLNLWEKLKSPDLDLDLMYAIRHKLFASSVHINNAVLILSYLQQFTSIQKVKKSDENPNLELDNKIDKFTKNFKAKSIYGMFRHFYNRCPGCLKLPLETDDFSFGNNVLPFENGEKVLDALEKLPQKYRYFFIAPSNLYPKTPATQGASKLTEIMSAYPFVFEAVYRGKETNRYMLVPSMHVFNAILQAFPAEPSEKLSPTKKLSPPLDFEPTLGPINWETLYQLHAFRHVQPLMVYSCKLQRNLTVVHDYESGPFLSNAHDMAHVLFLNYAPRRKFNFIHYEVIPFIRKLMKDPETGKVHEAFDFWSDYKSDIDKALRSIIYTLTDFIQENGIYFHKNSDKAKPCSIRFSLFKEWFIKCIDMQSSSTVKISHSTSICNIFERLMREWLTKHDVLFEKKYGIDGPNLAEQLKEHNRLTKNQLGLIHY